MPSCPEGRGQGHAAKATGREEDNGDASRSGPSTAARTKAMADQVAKPRPPLTSSTETTEQPVAKIQVPLRATPKQMQAMFNGELVPMAGEDAIGMLRAVHAAFNLYSSLSGGERDDAFVTATRVRPVASM